MEFWTELYDEIAGKITDKLPQVAWVDLWHEQVNYLTEELPFPTPAVFVAFSTLSTDDRGTLAQDCNTQVDLYLFYETFSDTYAGSINREGALDFLHTLTELHALFHGKSGRTYSAMRRTDMRREESGGAGNLYRLSLECRVTDYSACHLFVTTENPDAGVQVKPLARHVPGDTGEPLFDVR